MDKRRLAGAVVVALVIAGCGSSGQESSVGDASTDAVIMPDVVGKQLDVALSDIERGGIDDEVEVLGGGTFGVIDESKWMVCEQLPSLPAPASTEPPPSTDPAPVENITPENNAELAALLAGDLGGCGDAIDDFAATHGGRNIEFDGNIADLAPHGDTETRFDFLIYGGDYSLESPVYGGPPMKFEDVNRFDLNLIGGSVPDGVRTGDSFHIVAEVVESRNAQCLLILDPVSMELR